MNTFIFRSLFFLCMILRGYTSLFSQEEKITRLSLDLGLSHISFLDQQATPILHNGFGPHAGLRFERQSEKALWQVRLNGGARRYQPADSELRLIPSSFSGKVAGLSVSYLRSVSSLPNWHLFIGGSIREDIQLDFDGIGDFPWIFAPGGIYAKGRLIYSHTERHQFGSELSLPLFSWITDMPYNQIPRVEGRAPDVITILVAGTRIPSWASYQRVDLSFFYSFEMNEKWSLRANYDWAWMHDSQPRDMWAYQGMLTIGLSRTW